MNTAADTKVAPVPSPTVSAKAPVAAPAATGVAVILALVLIAVGVVAARDVLIWTGAVNGSPWITAGLNRVDGLTAQSWMLPVGLAVAILGLLLVFAAVKPRRRTHRPLRVSDTWITPRDMTRLARSVCEAITGIAAATVTGSTRKITITITPIAGFDVAALSGTTQAVVTDALAHMARPPRLRIRVKEGKLP